MTFALLILMLVLAEVNGLAVPIWFWCLWTVSAFAASLSSHLQTKDLLKAIRKKEAE